MKTFLLMVLPLLNFAQYSPGSQLKIRAKIVSDDGTFKGFFVSNNDSSLTISKKRTYWPNNTLAIPVNSINLLKLNSKNKLPLLSVPGGFVVGFIATALITQNPDDFDGDGELSFFEMLFSTIDAATSGNKKRRNAALIVGATTGAIAFVGDLLSHKKLSLVFPLSRRQNYYTEKQFEIKSYISF